MVMGGRPGWEGPGAEPLGLPGTALEAGSLEKSEHDLPPPGGPAVLEGHAGTDVSLSLWARAPLPGLPPGTA